MGWVRVACLLLLCGSACLPQQAVLALVPSRSASPPRDPLQPVVASQPPPTGAEGGQVAVVGSKVKADLALSAVSLVLAAFGGVEPMFGLFGTFDETSWFRKQQAARRRASDPENLRKRGRTYTPKLEEVERDGR